MFSSLWDAMLIRAETAAPVTEDTWKEELQGSRGQKGRKSKERRDRGGGRGGEKKGERWSCEGKGEDVGPLKEDAARRSQLSHLVLNP